MRVSKEQAAENRERILKAASRLMRERGISSVGVDALTEAAGMTHGSLYSRFGSKERLVEEAVAHAIATKGQEVPEDFELDDYVSEYLSAAHRDEPGSGCPFAALCCEMPRSRMRREAASRIRSRFLAVCSFETRISQFLKSRVLTIIITIVMYINNYDRNQIGP